MILITGGAGYIGSNIAAEMPCVIMDNLYNSTPGRLIALQHINKNIIVIEGDHRDEKLLTGIIKKYNIHTIIHCAEHKSIYESIKDPDKYTEDNIEATKGLINISVENKIKNFVYLSSGSVYAISDLQLNENSPLSRCTNPYSLGKIAIEETLIEMQNYNAFEHVVTLRIFNPIGAGKYQFGEHFGGYHVGFLSKIVQSMQNSHVIVDMNHIDAATYFQYPVRSYIHIDDLSEQVRCVLSNINRFENYECFNIGTHNELSSIEIAALAIGEINSRYGKNVKLHYQQQPLMSCHPATICDPGKIEKLCGKPYGRHTRYIYNALEEILSYVGLR